MSDVDVAVLIKSEARRAKAPHQCVKCRNLIEVGENHFYQLYKMDGQLFTVRQHHGQCYMYEEDPHAD